MDKYRRVEKPKTETEIQENEIRITTQGKMRNYITYATNLFQQKGSSEVVLKAMGRAINKTVTIAEIIKRRIQNLHQNTVIDSTDITDVWEPIEEGLDRLETVRHVSSIQITLSTKPLDPDAPGYQPPEETKKSQDENQTTTYQPRPHRGRYNRGYRRGRGGNMVGGEPHSQGDEIQNQQHEGVQFYRGRRRGGRGRGRREFNNVGLDQGNVGQPPFERPQQPQNEQRLEFEAGTENQFQAPNPFRGRGGRGRGGYRGRGGRGRGGRGRGGRGGFYNQNAPQNFNQQHNPTNVGLTPEN